MERVIHEKELEDWKKRRDQLVETTNVDSEIKEALVNVPAEYSIGLEKVLRRYQWSFSRNSSDCGYSCNWVADLKLNDPEAPPTFVRPYDIDNSAMEQVGNKLKEMNDSGIIQESSSGWNAPLLMIAKADKSIRIVQNYSGARKNEKSLNERLIMPRWPIMPIRSILTTISRNITNLKRDYPGERIFFVGIDIRNAYYTLSLRNSTRELTSFIFSDKQYEYTKMSQGLSTSPSTFTAFISKLFAKLDDQGNKKYFYTTCYMDDILITGVGRHMNRAIDQVLGLFERENIVVSLKKCSFYEKETKFLGFMISEIGFRGSQKKVDGILELDYPRTSKEAMRMLGCVNYFNRLIRGASELMGPLAKESGKGKHYQLTEQIKECVDALKKRIKENGVSLIHLKYYDGTHGKYCFIASDSSLYGTGACIGNCTMIDDQTSEIEIAAFCSRKLDDQEAMLSSRSRELIALSVALQSFRDIIPKSLPVLAFVDHQSLVNIRKNINLKTSGQTRVRKAFATVLDFPNLKIFYIPGNSEIINVVDYISRHAEFVIREIDPSILSPKKIETEEIQTNQITDITEIGKTVKEIDVDVLKKEQKLEFGEIMNGPQGSFKIVGKKEFIVQNDLLFEKVRSGAVLLVIPDCLADEIIQFLHVSSLHASQEEIFRKIRAQKILIKNRCERVSRLLKHCVYCKIRCTTKHSFEKQEFPREPALKCREKIHVDCLDIRTGNKENIFLTIVDEFSRKLFVHKLKNKKMDVLVPILTIQLAEIGGSYSILISDNGKEFLNRGVKEALLTLNILRTTNSPYNSRSNLCERAHKNIREKLRCTELTASNVEFKTLLAVAFLNHCPLKELNFLTPNQVWANLDPPNYLPQFTREEVTLLPSEKMSFLEELQTQVMSEKIGRYLFKTDVLENPFSEGDIVMLRDPVGISANKIKGPFRVVKTGLKSSVTICDLNNGVLYRRNGRHLFKIYVSKEDMEKFMGKGRTVLENKRNGELEPGFVGSPLDNMSIKFPEPFEPGFKLRSGRTK
ncbi:unnamed protein product [Oikopleura dioica]|uniref:ribonuclease H n=1 Tax=Oikopleura dioica TaxID=34765 RepID=E4YVU9_OIKDI|nr:unnamed protein product [Oikopleura dioica]